MPQAPQTSLDVLNQLDQQGQPPPQQQQQPPPAQAAPAAGAPSAPGAPPAGTGTSLDVLNQLTSDPELAMHTDETATERQQRTGQGVNDVGNVVIVPKENENYLDTVQRALAYHRSLTPQQQQEAIQREMQPRDIARKVGETGAAAVGMGAAGVVVPTELAAGLSAGTRALIPALTRGVVGFNEWAAAHPVMAKVLWEGLKMTVGSYIMGTAAGKVLKGAKGVIQAAPD
jgi:hypothetical protein